MSSESADFADAVATRCFDVDAAGSDSITVAGGMAIRFAASGNDYVLALTTDAGTSYTADGGVKTLGSISATGVVWLTLDDPDLPTTLTASFVASTDIDATLEEDGSNLPIALVTVAAGVITDIDQLHTELWISRAPVGAASVDDLSLDVNDDGEIQDFEWDAPTPVALASLADEDLFMYRDGTDASKKYIAFDDLVTEIAAELETQNYRTFLSLTDTPSTYPVPELDQVWVPVVDSTGTELEWADLDAFGVGRYWKLGGDQETCYGWSIGDPSQLQVIDLDAQKLVTEASDNALDWLNGALIAGIDDGIGPVPVTVMSWLARELNRQWTVTDTTDADGAAGGALAIAGGLDVAKSVWASLGFKMDADNYWTASAAHIKTSGDIVLASAGIITLADDTGGARIYVQNDLIELYPSSGGSTKINEKTVTWKRAADLDPDDYVLVGS